MKIFFKATILTLCLGFLGASVLPACSFVTLPQMSSSASSESASSAESSLYESSVKSNESSVISAESSVGESSAEDSSTVATEVRLDGVTYALNEDAQGYTVTGYSGEGGAVTIADELNDLPVTAIGENAFKEQRTLTAITIPDSIKTIGSYAFSYCEGLAQLVIPDGVTSVGSYAFAHCHGLVSIQIGDGVTELGAWSFYYCHSLTSVVIGDGVTAIGLGAFQECFNLTDVVLGVGVQSIEGGAFGWCNSLTNVYYKGGTREWAEVNVGANTELTSAKRYYYVEDENDLPPSGNYWHYDSDGEIVVWGSETESLQKV